MFNRKTFAQMRKAGMGIGISKAKLSQAMLEILLQLPEGTTNLKEVIIANMGLLGQVSATRDINEAWNQAKKKAAKLYPEKLVLDGRNVLHWNDGSIEVLDKKISASNFKKLNVLAEEEGCNVNKLISKMIKFYERERDK